MQPSRGSRRPFSPKCCLPGALPAWPAARPPVDCLQRRAPMKTTRIALALALLLPFGALDLGAG
jgi:hypothetical protein